MASPISGVKDAPGNSSGRTIGKAPGSLLEPATDARADASSPQHPFLAAVAITVIGYAVLTALMIGIGLLLTHALDGTVGGWDRHVSEYFARHRTSGLNDITKRATSGVSSLVRVRHADLPALIVAAAVVAFLARSGRWREGALLTIAFALEVTVFLSVKYVVARPRPAVFDLNAAPSNTSFPSGHTAAATVLFVGIALIVVLCTRNTVARTLSALVAAGVVGMVGFARVYRGLHFLTDVLVGALLGLACLTVAAVAVRAASRRAALAGGTRADHGLYVEAGSL